MTIQTRQSSVRYDGDGVSVSFAVPYPFREKEHLDVYTGTGEIGTVDTLLTLGLDYAVTYAVGEDGEAGGTVVLAAPLAVGLKIAILRDTPQTQLTDYPEGGRFPAQSHEAALDKLTMEVQELQDLFTRTPYGPPTSGGSGQEIIQDMIVWYEGAQQSASDAAGSAAEAFASEQNAAASAAASSVSASQAKADADRAASLVDPVVLASSVYNVRKAFVVENAVPAGGALNLPGYYFPTREVLFLSYNGVVCTPRLAGVEAAGEYQYEEVGTDPDVISNQVVVWFDVAVGDVVDMWVVASAAGRNIQEIESLVAEAALYSQQAADAETAATAQADRSGVEADRAEAAAENLPDVSTAEDGQTIVARNVSGVMRAGYEDPPSPLVTRQYGVLPNPLPAGTPYTVPAYIVGSAKLQIFMDGVRCEAGPFQAEATYQEKGTSGTLSTQITFYENLFAGTEVTAISAA